LAAALVFDGGYEFGDIGKLRGGTQQIGRVVEQAFYWVVKPETAYVKARVELKQIVT
jgi:hypothetical protein